VSRQEVWVVVIPAHGATNVGDPERLVWYCVTPACAGAQGPGDSTIPAGASVPISSTVTASFRRTITSAPSSPRYWTRL